MAKLLLQPERNGYSATQGEESLRVQLDGGLGRTRRDILDAAWQVQLTFICDEEEYNYLMAFYREAAGHGALEFTIDLYTKDATLRTCNAKFMPGGPRLASQSGLAYTVTADIEVIPPYSATQSTDDQGIIDDFEDAHGP